MEAVTRRRRKNETMTARSHKRRIPFATIFVFNTAAAVLPSRASGQGVARAKPRDNWIDEAEGRTLFWLDPSRRHKSGGY
jgi:anti-sigma factor RsiW